MDKLHVQLRNSGLTGNESKVYLELIRRGSLSANDISKKIGMDRTLSYTVLNHLIEKGLVGYIIRDKKKYFEATNPENLLNSIKEKEAYVKDTIKSLKKIERLVDSSQEVNVYEGKKAIRTFFTYFMKYKRTCSFGATGRAYDALYESPRLVKELEKMGFSSRIITHPKYEGHPMTKMKRIHVRHLNLRSEATTTIFKDMIAIHILTQKPIVTVIKSKEIAQSYQNHFEVLWKAALKA
jgi:sugar-specific transcriptional regulator TrmB